MMRVLVTGRTSFIGNAVIRHLSEFPGDFSAESVSVRDNTWRETGFGGFDAILHAAGIAHIKSDPSLEEKYMRVNRDLAVEIARRAKADGVKVYKTPGGKGIGRLAKNEHVLIFKSQNGWGLVKNLKGNTGYVRMSDMSHAG